MIMCACNHLKVTGTGKMPLKASLCELKEPDDM